ncbi:MAG: hypothetical protein Q7S03_01830 [bacterium]|nr:hypothetical protein [bacterium]
MGQLYREIDNGSTKDSLESVFAGLSGYVILHFATEENLFDQFGYEGKEEHKASHDKC